jgi:hypothetical protein
MSYIQTFESFNESYKKLPYDAKIMGTYILNIEDEDTHITIAGYERNDDNTDSLVLMDTEDNFKEEFKAKHGSINVNNNDMIQMIKGKKVKIATSKSGIKGTLVKK